jgi:hypothetical protein
MSLMQGLRNLVRTERAYQTQSIALITLCRHLVENGTNPRERGNDLRR